jgi:hypothetical protein
MKASQAFTIASLRVFAILLYERIHMRLLNYCSIALQSPRADPGVGNESYVC